MRTFNVSTWKPLSRLETYLKFFAATLANSPERLTFILIGLNLCITLPLANLLNVWFDEAYSLNTSGDSLEYAVVQAIHFEEQAPLYFVLLCLWRKLNASILFARLFSILCISLTIYLTSVISKKLFKIHSGWATATVAFNPFMIWAAVEIRLFAFSILLSAAALLLFIDGYLSAKPRVAARWLHVPVAIAILYTHYFLAFSLVAYAVILALKRRQVLSYCLHMIPVAVSFLPLLLIILTTGQTSAWSDNSISSTAQEFAWIENVRTTFAAPLLYGFPAKIGDFSPLSWKLLRILSVAGLATLGFAYRRSIGLYQQAVWILTLAIATFFFIVFELFTWLGVSDSIQSYRHTISLLLPTLLSVIAVFSLIQPDRSRKLILTVWLSFTLLLYGTSLYLTFSPLAKDGDYIRVAAYLVNHESLHQPILVFNSEVEMALAYYYKGVNPLLPLPQAENFQVYDLNKLQLKHEQEIFNALSQFPRQQLWLVTDTFSLKDKPAYSNSYRILDDFVTRYYSVKLSQDFYGSNIKFLQLNQIN